MAENDLLRETLGQVAQVAEDLDAANTRLAFLLDASTTVAGSLDYAETFQRLARLAVPALADFCVIDILQEDGSIHRVAAAHADPAQQHLTDTLREDYSPDPDGSHPAIQAMRSGEAVFSEKMPEKLLYSTTRGAEHVRILRELGLISYMCVPIIARQRVLGCVTFNATNRSGRRYSSADLALAKDLVHRIALTLDNARLYHEQRDIAQILQRSLLPESLPEIPGVQMAVRYLAAKEGTEVGGDFYDIWPVAHGAFAAMVGDVCGKGPRAAALTSVARHSARTASLRESTPSRVLSVVNEVVRQQTDDVAFCTLIYAHLRQQPQGYSVVIASGGHPWPAIVRRDGTVERVELSGCLLGIYETVSIEDRTVDLNPGDVLVLWTDGVTDRRGGREIYGEDRLVALLEQLGSQEPEHIVAAIEQSVVGFSPDSPQDDIAALALRISPVPKRRHLTNLWRTRPWKRGVGRWTKHPANQLRRLRGVKTLR